MFLTKISLLLVAFFILKKITNTTKDNTEPVKNALPRSGAAFVPLIDRHISLFLLILLLIVVCGHIFPYGHTMFSEFLDEIIDLAGGWLKTSAFLYTTLYAQDTFTLIMRSNHHQNVDMEYGEKRAHKNNISKYL